MGHVGGAGGGTIGGMCPGTGGTPGLVGEVGAGVVGGVGVGAGAGAGAGVCGVFSWFGLSLKVLKNTGNCKNLPRVLPDSIICPAMPGVCTVKFAFMTLSPTFFTPVPTTSRLGS